jgi:hypothetical protein
LKNLEAILELSTAERLKKRYEKFRSHGQFIEKAELPENNVPQGAAA